MRIGRLVVLALGFLSTAAMSDSQAQGSDLSEKPKISHDGRFGTRCHQPAGEPSGVEQCEVSFLRLAAVPESYHGRRVKLVGFLAQVFDRLVLYPDQASHQRGMELDGIEIADVRRIPQELREAAKTGRDGVMVIGTFDANYLGEDAPRLGAIRDVRFAAALRTPMPDRSKNWAP